MPRHPQLPKLPKKSTPALNNNPDNGNNTPVDYNYYLELFKTNKINNYDLSIMQFCENNKLLYTSFLSRLHSNPEVMDFIKEEVRKRYGMELLDVDRAIIKKAKTGDSRAAELAYKRYESWNLDKPQQSPQVIIIIPNMMLPMDQRNQGSEPKTIELKLPQKRQEIELDDISQSNDIKG